MDLYIYAILVTSASIIGGVFLIRSAYKKPLG